MITLISTIVGLISGFIPSIVNIFAKRQEYNYQLELTKLQLNASEKDLEIQKQIQVLQSDTQNQQSVHSNDSSLGADTSWVGQFKNSVRPVITYVFFFFFIGVKSISGWLLLSAGVPPMTVLNSIWDQNTQIMFGVIISFWFGSKTIENMDFVRRKVSIRRGISPINKEPTHVG